jgi:hypothetical protein
VAQLKIQPGKDQAVDVANLNLQPDQEGVASVLASAVKLNV